MLLQYPELEGFRRQLARRYRGTTTACYYSYDLRQFFEWVGKPPLLVQVRDVDAFIDYCQNHCKHKSSTINRKLAALKKLYDYLDEEDESGLAISSPVLVTRHYIKLGKRLPRDVEDRDIEKLFAAVDSPRDYAMFALMLLAGLRVGEVCNLSQSDLYLSAARDALPRLWLRGKGGGQRVAYLGAQALVILSDWLAVRPEVNDDAVFVTRWGKRFTPRSVQWRLDGYCEKAGVTMTCHQFRHTFGRHMIQAGMPVTTLQKLLGHVLLKTTEVYISIADSMVQHDYDAAIKLVEKRISLKRAVPQAGGAR
jgi:site-specific recombinase XerD